MLLLAGLAHAGVTFERVKTKVETEDPGSIPDKESEVREWRVKISDRATYAAFDQALEWRAGVIEACLRSANAPAAKAVVDISLSRDGAFAPRRVSGDEKLAECVATGLQQPAFIPVYRSLSIKPTVTWDPSTPALPTPPELPIDREQGFSVFSWGEASSGSEGMSYDTASSTTTFMGRNGELFASVLGSRTTGARYGFDNGEFYTAILHFSGSTDAWKVRDSLTKIYGPSKWDTSLNSYYWRGETNILLYRVAGEDDVLVTLLNIERARKSGLADRLPGDKSSSNNAASTGRRLPKTYKAGEKPAEEEPTPEEPTETGPEEPAPAP